MTFGSYYCQRGCCYGCQISFFAPNLSPQTVDQFVLPQPICPVCKDPLTKFSAAGENNLAPTAYAPAIQRRTTSGHGHPIEPHPDTPGRNLEPVPALGSSPAERLSQSEYELGLEDRNAL